MRNEKHVIGRYTHKTDVGKVRLSNEDQAATAINENGDILLLVCDGMGGQKKGDFASQLACKTIIDSFKSTKGFFNRFFATGWIRKAIQEANKTIYSLAQSNEIYKDMGTTLSLVLIYKGIIITAQIGDSRIYSMGKDKKLVQLSEDQTYVAFLYRTGQLTKEEMKVHPERHVLMNALGVYPSASADILLRKYNGETVLVCSDGLYNNIPEEDIASIIRGDDTVDQKANELIALANKNGGSDNIAVSLWECDGLCQ